MSRIDKLAENYKKFIALPWQKSLSGAERAIFVVYDKTDERRLRARLGLFITATKEAGHDWHECDLTRVFAEWMADTEYRDAYFESPEDLELTLEDDFLQHVAARVRDALTIADEDSVVALYGLASLFGFVRVSELLKETERYIKGRAVVFFPGEYDKDNYRLLGAKGGWNYLAVPITQYEDRGA